MNDRIAQLNEKIEPYRQQIIHHPLYHRIKSIDDLKIFMQYHVYAVWDFMSLLKSLQNQLTCTTIPWYPKGDANTRFLINEIVVGEESDVDEQGNRISHFELYLSAMNQCGANTSIINALLLQLHENPDVNKALTNVQLPAAARAFVSNTFDVIATDKAHIQAAVFTFGREDLIPNMFMKLVEDIQQSFPESVSTFKYYLERHIEVDGGHHSHLALAMTAHLCGTEPSLWDEAEAAVITALEKRIQLWDGALEAMEN